MSHPYALHHGDCLDVLRTLPDCSVDAVVTDPPYGLAFMGKRWDYDVPSVDVWAECLRVLRPGGHLLAFAGTRTQHRMAIRIEDAGFEIRDIIAWVYGSGFPKSRNLEGDWAGWGTALKPALEPLTVARKPLTGTVAANVLEHGTGALNIDGCRIEGVKGVPASPRRAKQGAAYGDLSKDPGTGSGWDVNAGRWPANLIHDGSDEPTQLLGDAARFFYCPKATKKERGEGNTHPTVKPVELMRYLCRLVTPPSGTVLDPFAGSGTTLIAAVMEGFYPVGVEREDTYVRIATDRLNALDVQ